MFALSMAHMDLHCAVLAATTETIPELTYVML